MDKDIRVPWGGGGRLGRGDSPQGGRKSAGGPGRGTQQPQAPQIPPRPTARSPGQGRTDAGKMRKEVEGVCRVGIVSLDCGIE